MKLSFHDWLDYVCSITKIRQDNDVINHISLVYIKLKLNCRNLSDLVWYVMKTRVDNEVTDRTGEVYSENDNELL